jgi:hypothetical protein
VKQTDNLLFSCGYGAEMDVKWTETPPGRLPVAICLPMVAMDALVCS